MNENQTSYSASFAAGGLLWKETRNRMSIWQHYNHDEKLVMLQQTASAKKIIEQVVECIALDFNPVKRIMI